MTLEEFIGKKYLSKGSTSVCYLIGKQKDRVLKIFNTPLEESMADKFNYFLNYKNDSFIFPHELIVQSGKFLGYITKKSDGIELEKVFLDMDLNAYANKSKQLDKDINYLSSGKIIISDLSIRNILCEIDSLKVIDPDYYRIVKNLSIQEVEKINNEIYKQVMLNLFLYPYAYTKQNKSMDSGLLKKIKEYLQSDIQTSEFIINLKEDLENYYDSEINNIKELVKILRR